MMNSSSPPAQCSARNRNECDDLENRESTFAAYPTLGVFESQEGIPMGHEIAQGMRKRETGDQNHRFRKGWGAFKAAAAANDDDNNNDLLLDIYPPGAVLGT